MQELLMGIFSLFGRKSKLETEIDGVWMTQSAKYAVIRSEAEAQSREALVVVLAHFEEIRREVEQVLNGLPGVTILTSESQLTSQLARPAAGVICVALARMMPSLAIELNEGVQDRVSFLVAERYPLRERDDVIKKSAGTMPWRCSLKFYMSLDDPVLAQFGVEQLRDLLVQLGMAESDEISNPTVDRAVARAQKKFKKNASGDLETESPEAWFEFNIR